MKLNKNTRNMIKTGSILIDANKNRYIVGEIMENRNGGVNIEYIRRDENNNYLGHCYSAPLSQFYGLEIEK